MSLKKTATEEIRSELERKMDYLTQANEGLMIQNESLDQDVSNRDKLLEEARVESEVVRPFRDWLLQVWVVRIMDKVIEHLSSLVRLVRSNMLHSLSVKILATVG